MRETVFIGIHILAILLNSVNEVLFTNWCSIPLPLAHRSHAQKFIAKAGMLLGQAQVVHFVGPAWAR